MTLDKFSFELMKYMPSFKFLNHIAFIILPKQIKFIANENTYIIAGKIMSLENRERHRKNLFQNPIKGAIPNNDKNRIETDVAKSGFHDDIPLKSLIYSIFWFLFRLRLVNRTKIPSIDIISDTVKYRMLFIDPCVLHEQHKSIMPLL